MKWSKLLLISLTAKGVSSRLLLPGVVVTEPLPHGSLQWISVFFTFLYFFVFPDWFTRLSVCHYVIWSEEEIHVILSRAVVLHDLFLSFFGFLNHHQRCVWLICVTLTELYCNKKRSFAVMLGSTYSCFCSQAKWLVWSMTNEFVVLWRCVAFRHNFLVPELRHQWFMTNSKISSLIDYVSWQNMWTSRGNRHR